MTEGRTVELTDEDIYRLTAQMGESWVEDFLGDRRARHNAIVELCDAVDELTDLEFSMAARLTQAIFHPGAADNVSSALASLVPDSQARDQVAHLAIAVLITDAVVNVFAGGQMPRHNRHQRRVDDRGCTCGWSGGDMLGHLLAVRRNQEVVSLAPLEELAFEANRQLRDHLRDPEWAATYWQARSRAEDNVPMLFEALRRLGATVEMSGGDYRVRFKGASDVERQALNTSFGFPVAIDAYDWTRPPGRFLAEWAERQGLTGAEVAERCGLSLDVYDGILLGSERITTNIAIHLESGTGSWPANVWLMLERNYRAALIERAHQVHH